MTHRAAAPQSAPDPAPDSAPDPTSETVAGGFAWAPYAGLDMVAVMALAALALVGLSPVLEGTDWIMVAVIGGMLGLGWTLLLLRLRLGMDLILETISLPYLLTAGLVWTLAGGKVLAIGLAAWLHEHTHAWYFKTGEATLVFLLFFKEFKNPLGCSSHRLNLCYNLCNLCYWLCEILNILYKCLNITNCDNSIDSKHTT